MSYISFPSSKMANNVTCETLTRKNLRFSHDLKAVSVGGVIMNSYIQEPPMNQHRNESSMVQFAYPEDNRNDVNESSFPIISGSFSHAFPMLFPFECRLKNGPTKSPAASPCSAAHCAGRPGATPWLSPRDLVKGGKWLGVFWFGWDRHLQFDSLNCSDILWYIYICIYIIYILDIIKLLDDFGTYLIYQYIGK